MHITKSDLHQAPASQSSPREPHELVIVVRDEDLSAVRRLRDDIERVVEIHANGPNCVITENNITRHMFESGVANVIDPNRTGINPTVKSNVLTADGPREYRVALHRGMVRVQVGNADAYVERNGSLFCIHEHKNGTAFIHHVNDTADLLTAVTRAAELLAARA